MKRKIQYWLISLLIGILLTSVVSALTIENGNSYARLKLVKNRIFVTGFQLINNEKYTLVYNNTCLITRKAYTSLMSYCSNGKCGYVNFRYFLYKEEKKFDIFGFTLMPTKDIDCKNKKILNYEHMLQ